jgi:ribosome-associated protein
MTNDEVIDYKSKTQKKREAEGLQKLGEKLVKLSNQQLEDIDMPEEIREAVEFAGTLKSHGARRRQMQYIGTLMRKIDPGTIQEAIGDIEEGGYRKAQAFKETEKWRDELIAGNKGLMEDILDKYPAADRQQLSQLIRNAIKEKEKNKPPKLSRILFRYLSGIRNK